MPAPVTIAVEGDSDDQVARRILEHVGFSMATSHVLRGKSSLDPRLKGYNNAARFSPWLIIRDFDHDAPCASALLSALVGEPSRFMCLRFPIHAIESWLIADGGAVARFLKIPVAKIPGNPDSLQDPKGELVNLARLSRRRAIREDMVPALSRRVGPGYTARVVEFALRYWHPDRAAEHSDSLRRCLNRLGTLPQPPGFVA